MEIKVDVAGAFAKLSAISKATADLSPVFAGPINESIDQLFTKQFASEGAYGGQKWASLSPATKILRRRRGHGRGGIGRDTNEMWASLTKLGLGPHAIKNVTASSIERGSDLKYAQWFSGGFMSKTFPVFDKFKQPVFLRRKSPKQIAARPLIPDPIPNAVVASWEKLISDYVTRQ